MAGNLGSIWYHLGSLLILTRNIKHIKHITPHSPVLPEFPWAHLADLHHDSKGSSSWSLANLGHAQFLCKNYVCRFLFLFLLLITCSSESPQFHHWELTLCSFAAILYSCKAVVLTCSPDGSHLGLLPTRPVQLCNLTGALLSPSLGETISAGAGQYCSQAARHHPHWRGCLTAGSMLAYSLPGCQKEQKEFNINLSQPRKPLCSYQYGWPCWPF